jgi:uncharacterized protein
MTYPEQNKLYNDSLNLLEGKGVQKNDERAFELNQMAASEGHADAVLAMGWFYLNGTGVKKDIERAQMWYRKSAKRGDPRAMFSLGQMAYTSRDWSEARLWFQRAIDNGHKRSLFWLGKLYWKGAGVAKDQRQARQLFHQAASQKVKEAQRAIRIMSSRN